MKQIAGIIAGLFFLTYSYAQNSAVTSEILTHQQVAGLFSDSICQSLNITFPIFRVYRYADQSGQYYCVLTESRDKTGPGKDTINHKIKAFNFKAADNRFVKTWEINDWINTRKDEKEETTIWFWSRYMVFKDYDNDGLADPILVYGIKGGNDYDDGRVKFIIYFKGKKYVIRHQNGVLDDERQTEVDKAYYELPSSLQAAIHEKMVLMTNNNQAIFPYGWEKAMKQKKVSFSER